MRHNRNKKEKNERCKVCEIIRHAQIAGTEKHVYLLASNLDKENFKTSVCLFEHGELVDNLNRLGIETHVITKSHSPLHFLKLIVFLYQKKFDIVHCHSGGYVCLAAKLAGIRYIVYTKHGIGFTAEELRSRSFFRKLRDFLIDKCVTIYIALTNYDKFVMTQIMHISENKIRIIHNGIDPKFGEEKPMSRNGYPIIGIVARLTKQKGISYLIKAIPIIAEKYKNVKVLIAGSGEEESTLRNLANRVGVLKRIEFLGYVKDVASIINCMDIFVLPSIWEGFPYVLLEAMLLKKPIVATNIFGVNEIIEHEKTGILVEPRNPDSMADAIIELLSNKKKAQSLGNVARRRVLNYFTLDKTISRIEQLYYSLMKK